jgi:hypothetical protein
MQTCPHCQFNQVPEGSRFCLNCGGKLAEVEAPSAKLPATTMQVKQDVGRMEDGAKAVGMESCNLMLQTQGWIDNSLPFQTVVQVVDTQQGVYVTRGADGLIYNFARMA